MFLVNYDLSSQEKIGNLLSNLNEELFSTDKDSIKLVEYLIDCKKHKIDSSKFIRVHQPNVKVVLDILEQLMHTKDISILDTINDLYNKHLINFESEWEKVNFDNYYSCDAIRNQVKILKGFETTLKGLYISNMSDSLKFDLYYKEKTLNDNIVIKNPDRMKYIDQYLMFSQKTKWILATTGWLKEGAPFTFIDPYLKDLEPFIVNKILELDTIDNFEDQRYYILFNMIDVIQKLNTYTVREALLTSSDKLVESGGHFLLLRFLEKNNSELLAKSTIRLMIDKSKRMIDPMEVGLYYSISFGEFFKTEYNTQYLLDELARLDKTIDNQRLIKGVFRVVGPERLESLVGNWKDENKSDYKYLISIKSNLELK